MTTDSAGRIPVVAVVDAWNFRSQVRAAFGQPRHATVDGVVGAFRPYGFEVVEVCFALGVESVPGAGGRTRQPSAELTRALQRNAETKRRWEADSRARVLAGRLVDVSDGKDGKTGPAEKMVDVLCAVEICRLAVKIRDGDIAARGIICLSKDMDLIPAYRFAEELGVPVWVASGDTVHSRHEEHRWLLLSHGSLAAASGLAVVDGGHERRRKVAEVAIAVPSSSRMMTVRYIDRTRSMIVLEGADDLAGILPLSLLGEKVQPADRLELWPAGVDLERSHRDFPMILFDVQRRPVHRTLENCRVERWVHPTGIVARGGGERRRIQVPPGFLLPGMEILIAVDRLGRSRYIGPSATGQPCRQHGAAR